MVKIQIHIIKELKKRDNVDVEDAFLALLASIYPKHWNWKQTRIVTIVKTEPLSDSNVRFATAETVTRDTVLQAVHSLNTARKTIGKDPVLNRYAKLNKNDGGLLRPITRNPRPHTLRKKQHYANTRVQSKSACKRYIKTLQCLQKNL